MRDKFHELKDGEHSRAKERDDEKGLQKAKDCKRRQTHLTQYDLSKSALRFRAWRLNK